MEESASISKFFHREFMEAASMPIIVAPMEDDGRESGSRKRTSRAWEYFEKLPATENGEVKARCKFCNDVFSAKGNSGTSHLLRHIPKCPNSCQPGIEPYMISNTEKFDESSIVRNCKFDPEVVPIMAVDVNVEDVRTESGSKRSKSRAWEYFEKLPATENVEAKAQCKFCKDVFSATGRAGTSHLLRHVPKCPKTCRQYMIATNRKYDGIGSSTVRNCRSNLEVVSLMAPDENLERERTDSGSKKVKSRAWEVFEKVPPGIENGEEKAQCKYCKDVFSAKASAGTSHLLRHIPKCPKISDHDDRMRYMISTERKSEGNFTLKNNKLDAESLCREIAMIVINGLPFSTVEESGFRNLMSKICPEFTVMDQKSIKQVILSLFKKEGENVKELLASCPGRICLTLDTWKSITDDQYICVTAHYIDREWKLQKRILRFKRIPPPYETVCLDDEIALCLTRWNIEHKLFSITLANVPSNSFVVASFIKAKCSLPCGGAFFLLRCCSHILNLVVQGVFDVIADIIEKLRLAIKYVKQSPHRKKVFYNLARNLNLDVAKKLCLNCPTRWNSTYLMLQVAFGYKNAFMYLGESDENFKHLLSDEEWEKVRLTCNFLKVFYEATCMFSGTTYPTANVYFKGLWKIYCRLLDVVRGPQTFMTDMVKEMQTMFSEYWSEYSLILSCAAILDPRYKVRYVEYCFTKIYGDEGRQHVFTIVNTLRELFNDYVNKSAASVTATGTCVGTNFNDNGDDDDADFATFKSEIIDSQTEKSQLDLYFEETNKDFSVELDVLEYWSSNQSKYPELSRMARDVLTIPISTVSFESSFITGHRMISPCRNALKAKMVQALVCLQDWIRVYDSTGKSGLFQSKTIEEDSSSSDEDF